MNTVAVWRWMTIWNTIYEEMSKIDFSVVEKLWDGNLRENYKITKNDFTAQFKKAYDSNLQHMEPVT